MFIDEHQNDALIFDKIAGALSIIEITSNLLRLPKTKFRLIEGHGLNCKVYEAKSGIIRLYLFHEENTGRVIVTGGKRAIKKKILNQCFKRLKTSKMKVNKREQILNQPSYWIENINALLYNAIVDYMEEHNMKQKDLAAHLNISQGRVSQILNDGDINFSLEKVIQIALKVGMYPSFKLEKKSNVSVEDFDDSLVK
ncbi:helix-turn-helix domain protein [Cyclobacterium marinum DSM 745]|uniref:Helix-turn-helix domain protein n=2 Tax=Cyclobacterium marinum TaxID=104 RepID=G0IZ61_CYCMS|nr:helix-turn-helix domain protein [Cyclobacterium marinum DSM 745]